MENEAGKFLSALFFFIVAIWVHIDAIAARAEAKAWFETASRMLDRAESELAATEASVCFECGGDGLIDQDRGYGQPPDRVPCPACSSLKSTDGEE